MNLENQGLPGNWQTTVNVDRSFVRYRNPSRPSGWVWKESLSSESITLSVVVPTADADRGGYFNKLLSQIRQQDFRTFELIVVRGDSRQGRAINIGAALARGTYLLTLDDDTSLPDPKTFSRLVAIMENHPDIGMAGGNNVIPQDASSFVREVMRQIPRRSWEPVAAILDSDLVEHPCMIMRLPEFKAVGGENELLPRGLDPYLRQAFREIGKRVVVVPKVTYHHLPPDTWKKLLVQFFRNGNQAAWVNRYYPQWMIETPCHHESSVKVLPLWQRGIRYPAVVFGSILKGQWIWFVCLLTYAWGFVVGWVTYGWERSGDRQQGVSP